MDDEKIVQLYLDRDESAISESSQKYGAYCHAIARNILNSESDCEECINDTWLHAWNSIPPHRPMILSTFLGKITRNISFDLYRKMHRQKRGSGNIEESLDELAECVSGRDDLNRKLESEELMKEINSFLLSISKEKRYIFILRYWYVYSIADIAGRFGTNENNIAKSLSRTRRKLKMYLTERGFDV